MATTFFAVTRNVCEVLRTVHVLCHPSGVKNFDVAHRFLKFHAVRPKICAYFVVNCSLLSQAC